LIFKQFYEPSLGHASYLVASQETGEALVLDARRDVDAYYRFAREQGLRIAYAADTHQHNDYLTGIVQLKSRGPLELLCSARAELGYVARPLKDGERIMMGEVEFEVLHTPGHTPEHISFLVRDHSRGTEPLLLLSGGALLVADVARPDLLGGETQRIQNASALCETLRDKILTLPDHVLVYPTHVAGSLCGGHIGSMLVTTIGYERRLNAVLQCIDSETEFTRRCLDLGSLPTVPAYWRRMRGQNQAGPPVLGALAEPAALQPAAFARRMEHGAVVVDCRSPEAYAGGHIPGSLNVGAGTSFAIWAGSVLTPDTDLLLVVESSRDLPDILWQLLRIGFPEPVGWLAGGLQAWRTTALPIEFLPEWTAGQLDAQRRKNRRLFIMDVRQPAEWAQGHVPGACHIPAGELPKRLGEVPAGGMVAAYCSSGYRSSVAASLLKRSGYRDVVNVIGGFSAWQAAGLPVEP
jgi:hydroxyacylglutathione hydrolase